MLRFTLKRLAIAALVALTVSLVSFGLTYLSGDPAVSLAGEGATQADIDVIRKRFGFDQSIPVQYMNWAGRVLTGDFGDSYYFGAPVSQLLAAGDTEFLAGTDARLAVFRKAALVACIRFPDVGALHTAVNRSGLLCGSLHAAALSRRYDRSPAI